MSEMQVGTSLVTSSHSGWTLSSGTGVRTHHEIVGFAKPFSSKPVMQCSLSQITQGKSDTPLRINVQIDNVWVDKFELSINTWEDSTIDGAKIAWIAFVPS